MKLLCRNFLTTSQKASSIIIIVLLISCGQQQESSKFDFSEDLPDEQADSLTVFAYNDSLLIYKLSAFHLDKYYKKQMTIADTVFVETYNADATVRSSLYCDKAEVDETRNILTGTGNVIISSENGILRTSHIIWDRNTDEVLAKGGVTVIRDNNILRGEELRTDIDLKNIEMIEVSAEGQLDEVDIDW